MRPTRAARSGASSRAGRSRSLDRMGNAVPWPSKSLDIKRKILFAPSRGVKLASSRGTRRRWKGDARDPRSPPGPAPAATGDRPRPRAPGREPSRRSGNTARPRPAGGPGEGGRRDPSPSRQSRSRPMSTAAASELPPPRPPATGIRFFSVISTPWVTRGEALEVARGAHGQVRLVRRNGGVIAAEGDVRCPRSEGDVVVKRDRLEQGPQLVIAVLARAEHLEARGSPSRARAGGAALAGLPAISARSRGRAPGRRPRTDSRVRRLGERGRAEGGRGRLRVLDRGLEPRPVGQGRVDLARERTRPNARGTRGTRGERTPVRRSITSAGESATPSSDSRSSARGRSGVDRPLPREDGPQPVAARHRDETRAGRSRHLDAQPSGPLEGQEDARARAELRAAQADSETRAVGADDARLLERPRRAGSGQRRRAGCGGGPATTARTEPGGLGPGLGSLDLGRVIQAGLGLADLPLHDGTVEVFAVVLGLRAPCASIRRPRARSPRRRSTSPRWSSTTALAPGLLTARRRNCSALSTRSEPEQGPAQAVEVGAVLRVEGDRPLDELQGLVHPHAAVGVHVAEVVEDGGGVRLDAERLAEDASAASCSSAAPAPRRAGTACAGSSAPPRAPGAACARRPA